MERFLIATDESTLRDDAAVYVTEMWNRHNQARMAWLEEVDETRRYLNATTTADTQVGQLPWKNKTTIPKLTQIRDNLVSWYVSALMPNEDWLIFEGANPEAERRGLAIEEYMKAKLRASKFRDFLKCVVLDWVDTGSCWGGAYWVTEKIKGAGGEETIGYVGPKAFRVSPLDCLMNERAKDFEETFFIRRDLLPIHDVLKREEKYDATGIAKLKELRTCADKDIMDIYRDNLIQMDGFTNFEHYVHSGMVEILEYWGDVYLEKSGTVLENQKIIIADRSFVLFIGDNPAWNGKKPYAHSAWRKLPENLYGSGPLHQLVGMQYRCDHLENLKADAFDHIVFPMWKIVGNTVEDFTPGPNIKINCGVDGDIVPLRPDATVLQCDNQVAYYHNMMELMAGSPRESMGFRTPGEKTAFEVDVLQQGADRIFMDRILDFEENFLEPLLNTMYELIVRNMPIRDIVRTLADDGKTTELTSFTREDVAATGWLRPVGARHFAARNKRMKELQNMIQLIPAIPGMSNHISGLRMGEWLEEELGFTKYNIVEENIGIKENVKSQVLGQQLITVAQQSMQGAMPNEDAGAVPPTAIS